MRQHIYDNFFDKVSNSIVIESTWNTSNTRPALFEEGRLTRRFVSTGCDDLLTNGLHIYIFVYIAKVADFVALVNHYTVEDRGNT